MREEALGFGESTTLVGVLTDPNRAERNRSLPSVILLNDGLIHRVGPNLSSVILARHLAEMGLVSLRFDFSGIGDSEVRQDDLPFVKSSLSEGQEAMTVLTEKRGSKKFILMGMCSGGLRALKIACADSRVVGVVLINPQPYHGDDSQEVHSYLKRRRGQQFPIRMALRDPRRWARALTGTMNYKEIPRVVIAKLTGVSSPKKIVSPVANQLLVNFKNLTQRSCHLLLVFSQGNPGLEYLQVAIGEELQELAQRETFNLEIVQKADHNFTLLWNQQALLKIVGQWVRTGFQNTPCHEDEKIAADAV